MKITQILKYKLQNYRNTNYTKINTITVHWARMEPHTAEMKKKNAQPMFMGNFSCLGKTSGQFYTAKKIVSWQLCAFKPSYAIKKIKIKISSFIKLLQFI